MFDSSLQRIRGITGIPTRQQELSARVARLAPFDGTHQSVMPSLALIRSSVPTVCMPTIFQPCLAIVVQGRKSALLNDEVFHYDPLNYLVVSVTLSGMGQVLEATPEHPYLSLRLNLDL
ncbi:MAG TPA: AraC family transcriptional regulator, partial [Steroidobacteraceae bacterium]|nr:AraC family transcriptional regulator [Steroidobacteraceae bacterium]